MLKRNPPDRAGDVHRLSPSPNFRYFVAARVTLIPNALQAGTGWEHVAWCNRNREICLAVPSAPPPNTGRW
ncbi:MAG: hypothetical protein OXU68_00680 [Bacteroidota bacterium]|nr:hypothetical protein [Bacteroidota bacterium]